MPLAKKRLIKAGFSIIEIVIFLAIIVLLTTITLTNFWFLQRSVVQLELSQLQAAFDYTRQLAIATNQAQTITFDQTNHSYNYSKYQAQLSNYTRFGFAPGTYGPPSDPKSPLTQAITFENQQVLISPQGVIAPGAIYLTDQQHKLTYALTVPLSQITLMRKYKNWYGHWKKI